MPAKQHLKSVCLSKSLSLLTEMMNWSDAKF